VTSERHRRKGSVSPGLGLVVIVTSDVADELSWLHDEMTARANPRGAGLSFSDDTWKVASDIRDLGKAAQAGVVEVVAPVVSHRRERLSHAKVDEVSTTEAAKRLKISRQAVLKRIDSGKLPARPTERGYRVSAEHLDKEST